MARLTSCCVVACILSAMVLAVSATRAARVSVLAPTLFDQSFNVLYGPEMQVEQTFDGRAVSLSMTETTGSGFQSKDTFLFGQLSLKIKLVAGDSAGVVVCFYMHSMTEDHDEFDFEFLGNRSGEPIILQTNIYADGKGGREERIALWFDPTEKFHTYTVLWNHKQVVFYVDSVPIRALKNNRASRSFFPLTRPMWVFSSIWNADDWATRGGVDKVDWASAPFVAHFKDFMLHGCVYDGRGVAPSCTSPLYGDTWWSNHADLNQVERRKLAWVRAHYMVYDYCVDFLRYNTTLYDSYPECAFSSRGY